MYSPELIKFLLNYQKEEERSSKKFYNFKDGNNILESKKLATVAITVKNR